MDAVTHVLIAVMLGLATRHWAPGPVRRAWVPVAGAAALAPDLDVFLTPLAQIPQLYWMSHRSASHSLLVAPFAGAGFVALLAWWGKRWRRLEMFVWDRRLLPAILVGAWSHLPLDIITMKGVPLWWPVTDVFVSAHLFFWIIPWLAPISFVILLLRYRGRWDDRRMAQAGIVVVAIIVVLAGVRGVARPGVEGAEVYPTASPWSWTVARQLDNGTWHLEVMGGGDAGDAAWYDAERPNGSADAVAALQESLAYRAFRFDVAGPIAIQVEAAPGGWYLNATAIVQAFELRDPPSWFPKDRIEEQTTLDVQYIDDRLIA